MKKLSILLFGMSYCEYNHWFLNKKLEINYKLSLQNYQEKIFDYFKKKDFEIDIYICTNILEKDKQKELIEDFKPIKFKFIKNYEKKVKSRFVKLINVIDLCLNQKINYDYTLITRFDLLFNKSFDNLNYEKINIVSRVKSIGRTKICDNFYFMPFQNLIKFRDVIYCNNLKSSHYLLNDLLKINNVHYLYDEPNKLVVNLSFYKIVRNEIN